MIKSAHLSPLARYNLLLSTIVYRTPPPHLPTVPVDVLLSREWVQLGVDEGAIDARAMKNRHVVSARVNFIK